LHGLTGESFLLSLFTFNFSLLLFFAKRSLRESTSTVLEDKNGFLLGAKLLKMVNGASRVQMNSSQIQAIGFYALRIEDSILIQDLIPSHWQEL